MGEINACKTLNGCRTWNGWDERDPIPTPDHDINSNASMKTSIIVINDGLKCT